MNGVLSNFDPRSLALLQTGMGMMAASGPSKMPVSFGQVIGQGGMQGIQAYQQAQRAQQEQQLHNLKLAEVEREAASQKQRQEAAARFKAQFPQYAPLFDVAPNVAVERAYPKPVDPKENNPFGKVTPDKYTPESWQQFVKTHDYGVLVPVADTPRDDDFTRALLESGVKRGSPDWVKAHQERAERLRTNAPLVSIPPQETAFQREVGQQMGQQYAGLLKADMNAPATIAKYRRLGNLLGQVNTGAFKGTTTDIKSAAKAMGIDLNALGVTDDVAPAQAARALSNQIALELRNPAGGAGMPGALSDKDREFLLQSVPGLENDPAAWPKMIEYRVKLAEREQQVAKMARAYRKKHGKFDEGFYDELAEWSAKNPLFPEATAPAPATVAPSASGWSIKPKGGQ